MSEAGARKRKTNLCQGDCEAKPAAFTRAGKTSDETSDRIGDIMCVKRVKTVALGGVVQVVVSTLVLVLVLGRRGLLLCELRLEVFEGTDEFHGGVDALLR